MGKESWTMAVTLCDSCKTTSASLFCRADSAYLCIPCDGKVHAANKLASRHERVWMCEVCEQAPAAVTCKADAAALCVTCDRDIHSTTPLFRRNERFPVVPFTTAAKVSYVAGGENENADINNINIAGTEAETALWLLPNLNINKTVDGSENENDKYDNFKVTESESEYLFNDVDPLFGVDLKPPHHPTPLPPSETSLISG